MDRHSFVIRWQRFSPQEKKALAKQLRTSVNYLSQVANGHRKPSARFLDYLLLLLKAESSKPVVQEDVERQRDAALLDWLVTERQGWFSRYAPWPLFGGTFKDELHKSYEKVKREKRKCQKQS
jgi:transcriptional regulator with XRE-family HTH domain